jgi:hypothetical protein
MLLIYFSRCARNIAEGRATGSADNRATHLNVSEGTMATITFNGQEYDSPEAMPPEVRRLYELANQMLADQNQDAIPDLFGQLTDMSQSSVIHSAQFVVDGKVYRSLDELPADARRKYEQAMERLDANRNGVPNLLEGDLFGTAPPAATPSPVPQAPAPQPAPVFSNTWSLGARLLIAGLITLLVVAAVLFFVMR